MVEVTALNQVLLSAGSLIAGTAGVTHTRLLCLREIADQERTVAEVAARLGVTRQGVQRTADALVDDGLACWADNPRHRRAKLLGPTARGRRVLRLAHDAHVAWVEQAIAVLPEDLPSLTRRLREISGALGRPSSG